MAAILSRPQCIEWEVIYMQLSFMLVTQDYQLMRILRHLVTFIGVSPVAYTLYLAIFRDAETYVAISLAIGMSYSITHCTETTHG